MPIITNEQVWGQVGYEPHEAQQKFHASKARFKVSCCGRRFGKSTSAVRDIWEDLFLPNKLWWIVGPTYELGEREFAVLHSDLLKMPQIANHPKTRMTYNVKQGDMRIELPWGTKIKVVSAEKPKSLQGVGLDGVIMSEAAEHEENTWQKYIRPALSDKRGRAIFPSTPKGFNYFYRYWMRGYDSQFPEWESWHFPSWANTAVFDGIDDPEIQEAKASLSDMMFRQEYAAEFTALEGRIYSEFEPEIHVRQGLEYNPFWSNYWAFDFGFSNPFVCLDIQVDPSDNVYVWREYYSRFKATIEHSKILRERENPPGFIVSAMFGDPAGADEIATLALHLGSVWGRKVSWKEGVEAVKARLKVQPDGLPKLFISDACPNLIREMTTLRAEGLSQRFNTEKNPREGQHKYDDHACDALRYFMSEYFILGAGSSLLEAYKFANNAAASSAYFTYDSPNFILDSRESKWPS